MWILRLQVSFIMISFLASLVVYWKPVASLYLQLFPFFLLITLIVVVATQNRVNTPYLNIFSVGEFIFYFWCIREMITHPRARKILLQLLWVYPLVALTNIIFIQKINNFHTVTYSLGCLLMVIVCIYYFFELFQLPKSVSLLREPAFWICSGLLFFYSCSFPIFGFLNLLKYAPKLLTNNIGNILSLMNILLYSSFTIAFLCRIRMRKSIS